MMTTEISTNPIFAEAIEMVVASGNQNPTAADIVAAVEAAHVKMSNLACEMAAGQTSRAKLAHTVLCRQVYNQIRG